MRIRQSLDGVTFASTFVLSIIGLAGCGGGTDRSYAPPVVPSGPPTPTQPLVSAEWVNLSNLTVARSTGFNLQVTYDANVSTRVDYYIDGLLDTSITMGGAGSGGPISWFYFPWNTATYSDGPHVIAARITDANGLTGNSLPLVYFVQNNIAVPFTATATELFPVPQSNATATGQLTINLPTGTISGEAVVTNLDATGVHIHEASATNSGPIVISLVQDGTTNRWVVPPGATLTTQGNTSSSQVDRLLDGSLYIDAHSANYPDGEIRRQLTPMNVRFAVGSVSGSQVVPPINTSASGLIAITDDKRFIGAARIDLITTGVDNAASANIYVGSISLSSQPISSLRSDGLGHWTSRLPADLTSRFNSGLQYVNVVTAAHPLGEIRGAVPILDYPVAATLGELQAQIFTPRCSSCHNGVGTSLPGSMNLTNGNSYAALVGADSVEQNTLKRVRAGFSPGSYLLHKVTGVTSITSGRMPLGGPYLHDAAIEKLKSWMDAGALNN